MTHTQNRKQQEIELYIAKKNEKIEAYNRKWNATINTHTYIIYLYEFMSLKLNSIFGKMYFIR